MSTPYCLKDKMHLYQKIFVSLHHNFNRDINYKTYNHATINQLRKRDAARLCKRGRVFYQRWSFLDDALQRFILWNIPRPSALWQRADCRHHERCLLFHQRGPNMDVTIYRFFMWQLHQPCRWRPRAPRHHQQRPLLFHQRRP